MELSDNILVAASGDQGDVEMFVDWLKVGQDLLIFPPSCARSRSFLSIGALLVVWQVSKLKNANAVVTRGKSRSVRLARPRKRPPQLWTAGARTHDLLASLISLMG